jgi:hypothetical protein
LDVNEVLVRAYSQARVMRLPPSRQGDDAGGSETLDLALGQAELGEDLGGVLA